MSTKNTREAMEFGLSGLVAAIFGPRSRSLLRERKRSTASQLKTLTDYDGNPAHIRVQNIFAGAPTNDNYTQAQISQMQFEEWGWRWGKKRKKK